jgi:hypothetical protein
MVLARQHFSARPLAVGDGAVVYDAGNSLPVATLPAPIIALVRDTIYGRPTLGAATAAGVYVAFDAGLSFDRLGPGGPDVVMTFALAASDAEWRLYAIELGGALWSIQLDVEEHTP